MRELNKDELNEIKYMLQSFNENNEIVNKDYIINLIEYLKYVFKLDDYIKRIRTSDIKDANGYVSSYEFESKTINATYKKLLSSIKRNVNINKEFISLSNELINFYITKVMFHEVHHARQFKEVLEGHNTFIKDLLNLDIEYFLTLDNYIPDIVFEKNKLYDIKYKEKLYDHLIDFALISAEEDLYNKNPMEIDAEVRALRNIIKIITSLSEDDNIKDYYSFLLYSKYLQGYSFGKDRLIPAAEIFIKARNRVIPEERIKNPKEYIENNSKDYSLNKRLLYGLSISGSEYNNIVDKFNNTITRLTEKRK